MKRIFLLSLSVLLLFLTACGGSGSHSGGGTAPTVSDILDAAAEGPTATDAPADAALQDPAELLADMDVSSPDADVDLTILNSTMVYAQVSQMLYNPEEFLGKTVKMEGQFAIYEGEDRNYYACLIADATACCQNGIEFDLTGDPVYPDDYPELGSDITVTGIFETYEEDGFQYVQLRDAVMDS